MSKLFRVELLRFPGLSRERAVAHLAEAFDLDLEEALIYIDAMPCIVRSDADAGVAKEYARELLRVGATIAIVDQVSGHRVVHEADALKERIEQSLLAAPAGEASPASAVPPAAIEADHPDAKENVYCPRCGHRQPAGDRCVECGHTFEAQKKLAAASTSAGPEPSSAAASATDVDIFQSLKGRHLESEIEAKPVRPLRVPTRRTRDFSLDLPAARRRRSYIWVLIVLAAAVAIAMLLMQPDEGLGPDDPLPEDAIPPPPGLRYRRL